MLSWIQNKLWRIATFLTLFSLINTTNASVRQHAEWQNQQQWIWNARISAPQLQKQGDFCKIQTDLTQTSIINKPVLPFYFKIIYANPENISINVNTFEPQQKMLPAKIKIFQDRLLDGDLDSEHAISMNNDYPENYPDNFVEKTFLGYQNGIPLTGIRIFPYKVTGRGKFLHFPKKIQVTLNISKKAAQTAFNNNKSVFDDISDSPVFHKRVENDLNKSLATRSVSDQPLIKLAIEKNGIYRIYRSALLDSLNDLSDEIKNVDPRTFKAQNKGNNIPIYVHGEEDGKFDKGDYIEFVGLRNPNNLSESYYHPFSDKNIYWISWGDDDGLRYTTESAQTTIEHENAIIPREYQYTEHIEENNNFVRLGRIATDIPVYKKDHWFYDSGISTGMTRNYTFELSHPNEQTTNSFVIKARLHGLTYTGHGHNATIYINNHLVARGQWKGQKPYTISSSYGSNLRNSFLKNGQNNIQIAIEGDYTEERYDKILFDWLEIKYYRKYRASHNFIEFSPPENYPSGKYHFPIENFSSSDISVYKVGVSKLTQFDINYNKSQDKYSIIVEDQIHSTDNRYFAASTGGFHTPISIQADTLEGLSNSTGGCDIVIISPQKWTSKLDRLTDFYRDEGLEPRIISAKDIYNEFSYGISSPLGIKDFLAYAYKNWTPRFKYVLLIGDANQRAENSELPTFFYQTYKWGASACDYWFTLVDDDSNLPQFALGRWPCDTQEELELLIEKRINYKKSRKIKSRWHNETLFIAGYENAFKKQSDYMIRRSLPKSINTNRIFVNPSSKNTPYWGGSDSLINKLNSGLSLINFYGHGGGAVWADRSLFTTDHLSYLDNMDRLPFISSMTCFTGDFANMNGLGELLINSENGGAIGLLGSSSVGWIKNDYLLSKAVYDQIFAPGIRVGDAVQIGKIKYLTANNYFSYLKKSMVYSYNLLGDPTVILPFTQEQVELQTNTDNPAPGDKIKLSGDLPFKNGEGYINLYNLNKYKIPLSKTKYQITNNDFQATITLPDTLSTEELYFNYYFRDAGHTKEQAGHTPLNIKGNNFYDFTCIPNNPKSKEEIQFKVKINQDNLKKVYCVLDTVGVYKYLDENGIEHVSSFQNNTHIDTINMSYSEQEKVYQLDTPLISHQPGNLIAVKFIALTNQQDSKQSIVHTIQIQNVPDLWISDLTQVRSNFPGISTHVYSSSKDTLRNVELKISDIDGNLFGFGEFTVLPDGKNELIIKGALGQGKQKFIAEIDPQNQIQERHEYNNISDTVTITVNTFPVLPDIGSSVDEQENDTLHYDNNFSIFMPPGIVSDSSAVSISSFTDKPETDSQPEYQIVPIDSIFYYEVRTSSEHFKKDFSIHFRNISDSLRNIISLVRWSDRLKIWLCENRENSQVITGYFSEPGKFALAIANDNTAPTIELSVDGKQFFNDSYISSKPNISIIGEDKNGVRLDAEGLKFYLDDNQIEFNKFNLPDTFNNSNYVTAQFRPTLEYGNHNIKVIMQDAAGNLDELETNFTVSDELKLKDYGNFPNPFQTTTTFIYELTRRVDDLKIKIYTVSGRLIQTIDNSSYFNTGEDLRNSGYHEITWDGLDKNGNFLANGVYFYKITIRKDNKTKTSIGKIAKSR